MLSMAVQPTPKATLPSPFSSVSKNPFKFSPVSVNTEPPHLHFSKIKSRRRIQPLPVAATEVAETEAPTVAADSPEPQVVVEAEAKTMGKPRLVLKFIWMDKNIGLGLDQVIPGHGSVPLSPYFFWPRKDAWEELKISLESKPWVSQKKMIILLNQATDIINLWQQSGGSLS
ncbi:hypothetical protein ACP275_05G032700 [Erythranthe tilingii]